VKVALIGYGKMGQAVEKITPSLGVEVVARIDLKATEAEWNAIENADVCIDFSHPDAVISNIKQAGPFHKPIVIGTSGWYDKMEIVKALVKEYDLGVIYAQNFSLGMHLFIQIVTEAAKLLDHIDDYDVALSEIHHRQKVDSPSATASAIADALLKTMSRKKTINGNLSDGQIGAEELHVSSVRVGTVPGTHTVLFDSPQDTITLTHQAHDRSVWAHGALKAAEWMQNKKGFFTINDMMEVLTCDRQK